MVTPGELMKRFKFRRCDEDDFNGASKVGVELMAEGISLDAVNFFSRYGRPAAYAVHAFAARGADLAKKIRARGLKCDVFESWVAGGHICVLVHV